jgi:hypothetical protein
LRILISGFTQRAVNSQKLRYDYLTFVYVLRDALIKLGHRVDHRAVTPGELLDYDRVLLCVGPTKSFTARFVPGTAWAFKTMRDKAILFCDDWSIEKTGYDFKNTLARWDKWVGFFTAAGPVKGQELEGNLERQHDVIEMLNAVTHDPTIRLLAPLFPWGNHQLLLQGNLPSKLIGCDPTPLLPPMTAAPTTAPRKRQWILATLQKKMKLPRGKWDVQQMGNKREGQSYLPEAQIAELYRQSWGVMCPPYQKAGSGWWRVRYQMAADAGSVLWLDYKDREKMGTAYGLTLSEYESLTDEELAATAAAQREWFYAHTATAEQTLRVLTEALA